MAMGISNIQQQLRQKVQQIEQDTKMIAEQSIWGALKEIQPLAEAKLQEIIMQQFYQTRPETEWYDRTYQFAKCGLVKPTHGGGHYVMQVWLDTTQLQLQAPSGGDLTKLWSYGYSYGNSLVGTPLDLEEKQQLIDQWDKEYNITETFEEWFTDEFPELFEKQFNLRMHRVYNYQF